MTGRPDTSLDYWSTLMNAIGLLPTRSDVNSLGNRYVILEGRPAYGLRSPTGSLTIAVPVPVFEPREIHK